MNDLCVTTIGNIYSAHFICHGSKRYTHARAHTNAPWRTNEHFCNEWEDRGSQQRNGNYKETNGNFRTEKYHI